MYVRRYSCIPQCIVHSHFANLCNNISTRLYRDQLKFEYTFYWDTVYYRCCRQFSLLKNLRVQRQKPAGLRVATWWFKVNFSGITYRLCVAVTTRCQGDADASHVTTVSVGSLTSMARNASMVTGRK